VLETLLHPETRRVRAEWYRVLRTGGRLVVTVPDLDWARTVWLTPPPRPDYLRDDDKFLEIFYGGRTRRGSSTTPASLPAACAGSRAGSASRASTPGSLSTRTTWEW
jgi:hypothetical protein